MTAVLFVCLGNICRSPLAEGVFRAHVTAARLEKRFTIDSAGCGGWHSGELPDKRSIAVAARYGIDLSLQRARKIQLADFETFDLILGLDRDNVAHLNAMHTENTRARVALYLQEALNVKKDVPDPYYGGTADFETVYRLCAEASTALLQKLITHKD